MSLALVDRVRRLPRPLREALYARLPPGSLATRHYDWRGFWARPDQLPPPPEVDWGILVFRGGRGAGKTRAMLELLLEEIFAGRCRFPRLVAKTRDDIEGTLVHGPSGILNILPRNRRPEWRASKDAAGLAIFPNGVRLRCCAACEPEQLVGQGSDLDALDDPAKWGTNIDEAWEQSRASCRLGYARAIVATTFRGSATLRKLLQKADFNGLVLRDCDTSANAGNLAPRFLRDTIGDMDEAFRRREIDGIDESAASPFVGVDFDKPPVRLAALDRDEIAEVVVAVDPAEGKGPGHDLWGIGAACRRHDRHVVALEDASGSYDDDEGARKALDLCETWGACKIIVEDNRGPRVSNALKAVWYERQARGQAKRIAMPEIVGVTAKEKKKVRAGPVRPLYLRGVAHHLPGLAALEKQQREWDPDAPPRPQQDDRIDWLVHAFFYLAALERDPDWAPPALPSRAPGAEEQRAGGSGVSMDWLRQRSPGASSSFYRR